MTLENLRNDVQTIYSYEDKTTQSFTKEYECEGNKIKIIFDRTWIGKGYKCGLDMTGSAKVIMAKKDPSLESEIVKIIQSPTYNTLAGTFPTVNKIDFSVETV